MKIQIQYYALFREEAGCNHETIEVESSDAIELFNQLREKYQFSLDEHQVRLTVNNEFVEWDQLLSKGDCVVFIPPVAGG